MPVSQLGVHTLLLIAGTMMSIIPRDRVENTTSLERRQLVPLDGKNKENGERRGGGGEGDLEVNIASRKELVTTPWFKLQGQNRFRIKEKRDRNLVAFSSMQSKNGRQSTSFPEDIKNGIKGDDASEQGEKPSGFLIQRYALHNSEFKGVGKANNFESLQNKSSNSPEQMAVNQLNQQQQQQIPQQLQQKQMLQLVQKQQQQQQQQQQQLTSEYNVPGYEIYQGSQLSYQDQPCTDPSENCQTTGPNANPQLRPSPKKKRSTIKPLETIQDQIRQKMGSRRNVSSDHPLCTSDIWIQGEVWSATVAVARTVTFKRFCLVFETETELCLLNQLWSQGINTEILDAKSWWHRISALTYLDHSQHILVGSLGWIGTTMKRVNSLYNNASINAMNTRWIWIPLSSNNSSVPSSSPSAASSPTESFKGVLDELSRSIQESVRGALIFREISQWFTAADNESQDIRVRSRVKIGRIKAPGNGTWILESAGTWNNTLEGPQILGPLWPSPSLNFQNRTVRITCIQKPKVFQYKESFRLDEATGYINDVMLIARQRLNFTDVLVPTRGFGLKEPNGSWNGMVGVLHRKEADMSPMDFSPLLSRSAVVEFSKPVGEDKVVILSKAPAIIIKPILLLQIFSPQAWACIFVCALVMGIVLEVMVRVESTFSQGFARDGSSVNQQMGNCLKIFVYQSNANWPLGPGSRLAAGGCILVALILGSLYSGSITAFFAIPFRSAPIDTVEDLLASNSRPALRSRTNSHQTLLAKNGILYEARERVGIFSGADITSWEFFKTVADGTFALSDVHSSAVGRANSFEKRGERCRFYLGKTPLRTDMDVFAFAKNSPILYQFDDTMQWLRYFGIIEHIKRKYYSVPCEAEISSDGPEPMNITKVLGTVYVLGIGLGLAFLAFVFEILVATFGSR